MRTTIDMPDELGRRVKIRAAQEGRSLKSLITQALEHELVAAVKPTVRQSRRRCLY